MADWYIPPLRALFPAIQWHASGSSVSLTFDDGPHPEATPTILEILRSEHITATFFLLGEHAERYPGIVRDIVQEGHTIGNHTQTHTKVWFAEQETLEKEVEGCQRTISAVCGVQPRLFRPPFGLFDPSIPGKIERMGMKTVIFSVNSWDFSDRSTDRIVARSTYATGAGDIIVLHDNDKTADRISDYLPRIIVSIRQKGLSFGPL